MANPRIDDLRKKLDKEPGSRLFAQLAEELRKEGDLAEAIRVSRHGLSHHPNYPSARMTLGRALLDSGDLAAARKEFETVLKGAPDNILASRYLAECLEGLGQAAQAIAQYKATLALAPGDKQVQARIHALETGATSPPATAPRAAEPSAPRPVAAAAPPGEDSEPAPIRLVEVEGPMELTSRYDEATPLAPPHAGVDDLYVATAAESEAGAPSDATPIPLAPLEEQDFELDRYDAPRLMPTVEPSEPTPVLMPDVDDEPILEAEPIEDEPVVPGPPAPAPPPVAAAAAAPPAEPEPILLEPDVIDEEFDVETPAPQPVRPRVTFRDDILEEGRGQAEAAGATPPTPPSPAPPPEPELSSPTLAELYFDQGFMEKALEVYRRLLEREPENERLRVRMDEIESIRRHAAAGASGTPASRQDAIGRAIARLQDLRAALARRD